MNWQPIETAPKSQEEVMALCPDSICLSVLIGRAEQPFGNGVIPGAVAECRLIDGKWCFPSDPTLRELSGNEYSELADPTHWMPLPPPPTDEPIPGSDDLEELE